MSSVIITTYFSQKIHPNNPNDQAVEGRGKDGKVLQNDIKYIKPWYESINNLKLNGLVFYDDLTSDFIENYSTEFVKFIKVSPSDYSNNDWRFFIYREYLIDHQYDNVFLTDGSDVTVVQDPNLIIAEYPEIDLFACRDSINLHQFPYINLHQEAKWKDHEWFDKMQSVLPLINMGVLGGSYLNMMEFLNSFCQERIKMGNPDFNADMWIGQYIFRYMLRHKNLIVGQPFTSNFKQYETDRKDVYFIHK